VTVRSAKAPMTMAGITLPAVPSGSQTGVGTVPIPSGLVARSEDWAPRVKRP
jgi:hypothetical protein